VLLKLVSDVIQLALRLWGYGTMTLVGAISDVDIENWLVA